MMCGFVVVTVWFHCGRQEPAGDHLRRSHETCQSYATEEVRQVVIMSSDGEIIEAR